MDTHELPTEIPVLPLRSGVLLPGTSMSLPVGRKRSLALMEVLEPGAIIGVAVQHDPKTDQPQLADLQPIGTLAEVKKIHRGREGKTLRVTLVGLRRFRLGGAIAIGSLLAGFALAWRRKRTVTLLKQAVLREELAEILKPFAGRGNDTLQEILGDDDEPGMFADRIASGLDVDRAREVQVLLTLDVPARLRLCARLIAEAKARWELKQKIGEEVRRELGKDQREAVLRQQLRAIQRELGEKNTGTPELEKLFGRLAKLEVSDEVRETIDREVEKLKALNPAAPDAHVTRNYLEWIAALPWNEQASVTDDVDAVASKLDQDHFGLEKVKERILEHLAVLKLTGNPRGSIMCLVGPPGVGKTSLGQSVADATGRPFIRVALGGVRDEAEIRGHRRTYVGGATGPDRCGATQGEG